MAKPRKGVVPPHLKPYLFKKKGKHSMPKKKKKKHSTAMTVYRSAAPVVVTKTRRVKVPVHVRSKSGSGRALMKREHGGGEFVPGPFRLRSAAVSGLIGYSESGQGKSLAQVQELLNKLPSIGKVPKEAIAGLILNYFADRGDWFDAGAQAFLDVGSYKFGQAGFSMQGDDDDY